MEKEQLRKEFEKETGKMYIDNGVIKCEGCKSKANYSTFNKDYILWLEKKLQAIEKPSGCSLDVVSLDESSEAELLAFLKWIYSKETDNLNCNTLEEIVKVYTKKQ